MEALIRVKQKKTNSVCNICTKEDCRLFETIERNKRYYQACDKDFALNYSDMEEPVWCGSCACHTSDYLCLACANKRLVSLGVKLT